MRRSVYACFMFIRTQTGRIRPLQITFAPLVDKYGTYAKEVGVTHKVKEDKRRGILLPQKGPKSKCYTLEAST